MAGQPPQGRSYTITATNGEFVNHPIMFNNRVGGDIQCPLQVTEPLGDQKITHAPQIIENQVGGTINTDVIYTAGQTQAMNKAHHLPEITSL